mgnify:CR=1 FL=1
MDFIVVIISIGGTVFSLLFAWHVWCEVNPPKHNSGFNFFKGLLKELIEEKRKSKHKS